jgi:hypothetical protein
MAILPMGGRPMGALYFVTRHGVSNRTCRFTESGSRTSPHVVAGVRRHVRFMLSRNTALPRSSNPPGATRRSFISGSRGE